MNDLYQWAFERGRQRTCSSSHDDDDSTFYVANSQVCVCLVFHTTGQRPGRDATLQAGFFCSVSDLSMPAIAGL